jgi:hypothetical protein
MTWYCERQVDEIIASMLTRQQTEYTLKGETYLTRRGAREQFGYGSRTLARLEEERLVTVKKVTNRLGRGRKKRVYRKADLEAHRDRQGTGFDGQYPDGRINLAAAAEASRFTVSRLKKYIALGWLSSVKQEPPPCFHARANEENTVLPADVETLVGRILESIRNGRPAGDWADAEEIAELVGAHTKELRIRIGSLLREGREAGAISHVRPDLPIKVRGGAHRRPRLYDRSEAVAYIRAETTPTEGDDWRQSKPPVVLADNPTGPVLVRGKQKSPLSPSKYRIVKTLLNAWPGGIAKDQLATDSRCSVPHKELKELRDSDADWRSVIVLPGRGHRGGYRIAAR